MSFPSNRARLCVCVLVIAVLVGCSSNLQDQRARDEKTGDEVAKATERAKPVIEEAGRKVGHAAESAAEEARAAAQGVKEGWKNGQKPAVDLNSATESQLLGLPGITKPEARKIAAARPFHDTHELVTRGIVSEAEYQKIHDLTTTR